MPIRWIESARQRSTGSHTPGRASLPIATTNSVRFPATSANPGRNEESTGWPSGAGGVPLAPAGGGPGSMTPPAVHTPPPPPPPPPRTVPSPTASRRRPRFGDVAPRPREPFSSLHDALHLASADHPAATLRLEVVGASVDDMHRPA